MTATGRSVYLFEVSFADRYSYGGQMWTANLRILRRGEEVVIAAGIVPA